MQTFNLMSVLTLVALFLSMPLKSLENKDNLEKEGLSFDSTDTVFINDYMGTTAPKSLCTRLTLEEYQKLVTESEVDLLEEPLCWGF